MHKYSKLASPPSAKNKQIDCHDIVTKHRLGFRQNRLRIYALQP